MKTLSPMARWILALVVLGSLGATTELVAQKRKLALDWADTVLLAVEEAKLRNVPIVLHIHGDT